MTDMVPTGLGFHSSHLPNSFGSSRHVGYIVHGQHEVKIAHKCDAFDSADAATLTQERECLQLPLPPPPPPILISWDFGIITWDDNGKWESK